MLVHVDACLAVAEQPGTWRPTGPHGWYDGPWVLSSWVLSGGLPCREAGWLASLDR